jgi:uncharacterized membrane protein YebE (DUF533 family)
MKRIVFATLVAAAALPLAAQTSTPRVDQREVNQQQRIEQGINSGQLTPKETAKLEKGEAKIDKMEAKAKSDGTVTAKERKKITKAQNKESKKIYKEKHDKQVAPKA